MSIKQTIAAEKKGTVTVSVLSYKDVMCITNLGRTTIWRLTQSGVLKLRQITPGRVGFLSDDVEEFLRSRNLVVVRSLPNAD